MILELFGMPASGKSTFRYSLVKNSKFETIKIKTRRELIYYNFLFLLKRPIRFFKLLVLVFSNSHSRVELYYKFMNCFLDYNAKLEKARGYKYALVDQGYYQNIISLFTDKISEKDLKKYFKLIAKPDILVLVSVDDVVREARLEEREIPTRVWLTREDELVFYDVAKHNYDLFMKIKDYQDLKILQIDTAQNLESNILKIKNSL